MSGLDNNNDDYPESGPSDAERHALDHGDFRPEDLDPARPIAEDFEIAPDFVDSALDRVLADQAKIASEADRVDDFEVPGEWRTAYPVPDISPDFVSRVAAKIESARQEAASHGASRAASAHDAEHRSADWQAILANYSPPEVTPDFVNRTLDALRTDRSGLRAVPPAPESRAGGAARRRAAVTVLTSLAAAALVALGLALGGLFDSGPVPSPVAGMGKDAEHTWTTASFSPTPWSTELMRNAGGANFVPFEPVAAFNLAALEVR